MRWADVVHMSGLSTKGIAFAVAVGGCSVVAKRWRPHCQARAIQRRVGWQVRRTDASPCAGSVQTWWARGTSRSTSVDPSLGSGTMPPRGDEDRLVKVFHLQECIGDG
jgi:hypothetical protein